MNWWHFGMRTGLLPWKELAKTWLGNVKMFHKVVAWFKLESLSMGLTCFLWSTTAPSCRLAASRSANKFREGYLVEFTEVLCLDISQKVRHWGTCKSLHPLKAWFYGQWLVFKPTLAGKCTSTNPGQDRWTALINRSYQIKVIFLWPVLIRMLFVVLMHCNNDAASILFSSKDFLCSW